MPYASKKQMAFLHAKKPGVAKKFDAETPKGTFVKLPARVAPKKKGY